jgi:hypothetical protein
MYYEDDITSDMAILPEIRMNVHKISQDMIASMKLKGPMICKPDSVDPVHNETELELVTSDGDDELPALKVESEAKEGEDDDAVTEASDSDNEAKTTNRSDRMVCMPKKYDGFEMTTAEIWLLQLEASLDLKSELSLIGATGAGFNHMSELHVMNNKQAMHLLMLRSGKSKWTMSMSSAKEQCVGGSTNVDHATQDQDSQVCLGNET